MKLYTLEDIEMDNATLAKAVAGVAASDMDTSYSEVYDYETITKLFGEELLSVHDHDYQGDSRILMKKTIGNDTVYGFLVFGWGSCSGCDALQACNSWDDLGSLIKSLFHDVRWFPTLAACQAEIADNYKQETNHWYHDKEWLEFTTKVALYTEPE